MKLSRISFGVFWPRINRELKYTFHFVFQLDIKPALKHKVFSLYCGDIAKTQNCVFAPLYCRDITPVWNKTLLDVIFCNMVQCRELFIPGGLYPHPGNINSHKSLVNIITSDLVIVLQPLSEKHRSETNQNEQ